MVTTHKFQSTAMVRSFACPATTPLRLSKSLVTCQQRHQRAEQAQHQAIPACVSHHLGFSVDLRLPTTVHVPVRDEPSTTGPVILSSTTVLLSDSIDNILQQLQKDLGPVFRVPVKGRTDDFMRMDTFVARFIDRTVRR